MSRQQPNHPTPPTPPAGRPRRGAAAFLVTLAFGGLLAATLATTTGCSRDPGPSDFEYRLGIDILENATNLGVGGFSPNPAVCPRGTLVLWTNRDDVDHRIVSTGGFFDSGVIKPGQSYQHIFREIGNFRYHDDVPGSSIQGVLNVIE